MNNPLLYVDPLGLWALTYEDVYKKNKDGSFKLDKNGNQILDHRNVIATKTQKDDNGASLAKQLGLTGKDAKNFAAKIGDGNNIRLADQGGEVSRVFGRVEEGLTAQAKWEAKNAGKLDELRKKDVYGPDYADCSRTAYETD
jgi:hypothetical protein